MTGIKKKILLSFGSTIIVIVASIIAITALQMNKSITEQTNLLASNMTEDAYKVVKGHHAIARSYLESVFDEVYKSAQEVTNEPSLFIMIEDFQVQQLSRFLQVSVSAGKADFGVLFDTQGLTQATYPQEIDYIKVEKEITNWQIFNQAMNAIDSRLENKVVQFNDMLQLPAEVFEVFKLNIAQIADENFLVVACSRIVLNDLGWPIGIYITGKVINGFDQPLQQLNEATGSSAVLYSNEHPVAQAGILKKEEIFNKADSLSLSSDNFQKIQSAEDEVELTLQLNNVKHLSTCSTFKSQEGIGLSTLCVSVPTKKIDKTIQSLQLSAVNSKKKILFWLYTLGGIALLFFICTALSITSGIIEPLEKIISRLSLNADHMEVSAKHMSDASHKISEDSSEQSNAIDGVSESLQSTANKTEENVSDATKAESLVKNATSIITRAKQSMENLNMSMEEISEASKQTSKIIKDIDAIAFQTNLLALNAAVEAARAGEAGAGFAVVADEVRNLAGRTAMAAKNTETLLNSTVNKVDTGRKLSISTHDDFNAIAESIQTINQVITNIVNASHDQATSIEQIKTAMDDINRLTTHTSQSAEESSTVSLEFAEQAKDLLAIVQKLVSLI